MSNLGGFVWSIADQLRGVYKPHQYGGVILPFTILRRLDCILEPTRDEVRALAKKYDDGALDVQVRQKTGFRFYNTSEYDFAQLLAEPDQLRANLIRLHLPVQQQHRRLRTVQVRQRDRHARREGPAVPGRVQVRRG